MVLVILDVEQSIRFGEFFSYPPEQVDDRLAAVVPQPVCIEYNQAGASLPHAKHRLLVTGLADRSLNLAHGPSLPVGLLTGGCIAGVG